MFTYLKNNIMKWGNILVLLNYIFYFTLLVKLEYFKVIFVVVFVI